eukprot:7384826-Prymnesium_polylepis.1
MLPRGGGGRRAPHLLLCAFAGEMARDVLPSHVDTHIRIASQRWRWAHDGSGGRETRPEQRGGSFLVARGIPSGE